jgi:hypothetical protein
MATVREPIPRILAALAPFFELQICRSISDPAEDAMSRSPKGENRLGRVGLNQKPSACDSQRTVIDAAIAHLPHGVGAIGRPTNHPLVIRQNRPMVIGKWKAVLGWMKRSASRGTD